MLAPLKFWCMVVVGEVSEAQIDMTLHLWSEADSCAALIKISEWLRLCRSHRQAPQGG